MTYQQHPQQRQCNDALRITTLGNFHVFCNKHDLASSFDKSLKIWELFKYFITFRDELILPEKIIASLWPEADYTDPKRTLRALIFRLRKALNGGDDNEADSIIVYSHGCYKLDTRKEDCLIDVVKFEELFHHAYELTSDDPGQAIEQFKKVVEMYKGEYLSETYGHDWVIPARNYYRRIFLQSIYEASELLKEQKRYQEILSLCETALKYELFEEEVHFHYIEALAGAGKIKQARSHYEYVAEVFEREMGVKPSSALRRLYRLLFGEISKSGLDMSSIEDTLREESFTSGPVLCDKEFFRFLNQLEKRRAERYGQNSFLALLTLSLPDYTLPPQKQLQEGMKVLKQILLAGLRKGDVITEWNEAQFLLSLPGLNIEQANRVLERIQKRFAASTNLGLILYNKVQDSLPVEPSLIKKLS